MDAGLYDNDQWAEEKLARAPKAGKPDTRKTAREWYPADAEWLLRWTCYAEFMGVAADTHGPWEDMYAALSDSHLRIYQEVVDLEKLPTSGDDVGRFLLNLMTATVRSLRDGSEALFDGSGLGPATIQQSREAISAWHHLLAYPGAFKKASSQWNGEFNESREDAAAQRAMRSRLWRKGMTEPAHYEPMSAPGLRELTRALDEKLQPYLRTGAAEAVDVLDQLLPAAVAQSVREAAKNLKEARGRYPAELLDRLGIDENGYTTLMGEALPKMAGCIARGESMLVLGPTSSGKSRIGRIAVCHAIARTPRRHGRAIVLLPTKALVNQAVEEWKEFLKDTPYKDNWRILPGSRDYPHNDELIARRDFDIAVMIPEKLAGLMAGGMVLDGCDILIIDELQNLADEGRGPRLEMLLTSIRARYKIPMIGLSATLTDEAVEQVRTWLNIDSAAVIRTDKRPVPLDLVVCDEVRARELKAEGHDMPGEMDLRSLLRAWEEKSELKGELNRVNIQGTSYRRALALAVSLLKHREADEGRARSVLFFVGSRQHAQTLAQVAQALLDHELGPVPPDGNPFLGRFSELDRADADRLDRALRRYPKTALRGDVVTALRTGVGYHSARLEQDMRNEIEKGFQKGLIRLLFATDTLKLGINLPADAVVVASVTTPTGKRNINRVLDRDTVAQRLGRAGRLGLSQRGYGYLVVPDQRPVKTRVELDDFELEHLAGRVKPLESEAQLDRALRALVNVDAVFEHYIGYIGEHTALGAAITSRVDEAWFAAELLQRIVRESVPVSREELGQQIDAIYDASLGKVTGAPAPDHNRVLALLRDNALIGPAPDSRSDPAKLAATGLGRAISTSGLPFADAALVERMMRAGLEGAGDLTLLWLAAQSRHVRESIAWISFASEDASGDQDLEVLQRDLLREMASVFAAEPTARKARAAGLRSGAFASVLPQRDLIGEGAAADELRRLIGGPAPDPGPRKTNALLRACVLLLWKEGCPLETLERAVEDNLRVSTRAAEGRTVKIHAADVRNLGENTSYLFDAARELTGVRPQGQIFRRFEALGESVEFGVPPVLLPLVRLRRRETHRERIVSLAELLRANPERARVDSAADLVDRYMRRRPGKVPPSLAEKVAQVTLTDEERAEVRKDLERTERRRQGSQVLKDYRDKVVPGPDGYRLDEALRLLQSSDEDGVPQRLVKILERYGLSAEIDANDANIVHLSSKLDATLTACLAVHTDLVTVDDLEKARGRVDIVLACAGATDGVRMAELRVGRNNPVVMQPAILLEAAARINTLVGPGEQSTPDEISAEFAAYMEQAADDFEEEPYGGAEPDGEDDINAGDDLGEGYESVGHRLLERLTAAPPMLGRTELNRLIAGITVGPPPAMLEEPSPSPARTEEAA